MREGFPRTGSVSNCAIVADKLWGKFQETGAERRFSTGLGSSDAQSRLETGAPIKPAEIGGLNKNPLAAALQKCASSVPKKAAVAWAQFTATMAQLETEPVRGNPSRMIRLVIEAGYKEHLQEEYANYRQRLEDLEQLANFSQQFKTLEEFLTQLALLTNVEAEDNQVANDSEQLRLSSIHQAKGLEFDVVFVIMLCDGLFPSARSLEELDGIEEERRLFYVAVTRARNELYLSYPLIRMMSGGSGDMMQQPSRFLGEIPKELVEEWNLTDESVWVMKGREIWNKIFVAAKICRIFRQPWLERGCVVLDQPQREAKCCGWSRSGGTQPRSAK